MASWRMRAQIVHYSALQMPGTNVLRAEPIGGYRVYARGLAVAPRELCWRVRGAASVGPGCSPHGSAAGSSALWGFNSVPIGFNPVPMRLIPVWGCGGGP
jgi:hypothetical protein